MPTHLLSYTVLFLVLLKYVFGGCLGWAAVGGESSGGGSPRPLVNAEFTSFRDQLQVTHSGLEVPHGSVYIVAYPWATPVHGHAPPTRMQAVRAHPRLAYVVAEGGS